MHRASATNRSNVELLEPLKELEQVRDRRITEDLVRSVVAEPFRGVTDEMTKLIGERLLRKSHRLFEAGLDPCAFAVVKLRTDTQQILRRIARGIVPRDREQVIKGRRVVTGVEQVSQSLACLFLRTILEPIDQRLDSCDCLIKVNAVPALHKTCWSRCHC
jgi:hypothetical protein